MKKVKITLSAFLAFIVIFCISTYILLLKERNGLLRSLKEREFQVEVLAEENRNLANENEALKREIESKNEIQENFMQKSSQLGKRGEVNKARLTRAINYLKAAARKIKRLNSEISVLNKENARPDKESGLKNSRDISKRRR